MRPKDEAKLIKAFPTLYQDCESKYPRESSMHYGFPGGGWFKVIWELSEKLEELFSSQPAPDNCKCGHNKATHDIGVCLDTYRHGSSKGIVTASCYCEEFRPDSLRAIQVKEKFGGLRFYLTGEWDESNSESDYAQGGPIQRKVQELIQVASEKAAATCMACGQPGSTEKSAGWLRTFCDDCNTHSKGRKLLEAEYKEKYSEELKKPKKEDD